MKDKFCIFVGSSINLLFISHFNSFSSKVLDIYVYQIILYSSTQRTVNYCRTTSFLVEDNLSFGLKSLERAAVSVPATKNCTFVIIAHSGGKCKWSASWQWEGYDGDRKGVDRLNTGVWSEFNCCVLKGYPSA